MLRPRCWKPHRCPEAPPSGPELVRGRQDRRPTPLQCAALRPSRKQSRPARGGGRPLALRRRPESRSLALPTPCRSGAGQRSRPRPCCTRRSASRPRRPTRGQARPAPGAPAAASERVLMAPRTCASAPWPPAKGPRTPLRIAGAPLYWPACPGAGRRPGVPWDRPTSLARQSASALRRWPAAGPMLGAGAPLRSLATWPRPLASAW